MAWVERRVTRTSQPQDAVGIDWTNPLARGLTICGHPNALKNGAYFDYLKTETAGRVIRTTGSESVYFPGNFLSPKSSLLVIAKAKTSTYPDNVGVVGDISGTGAGSFLKITPGGFWRFSVISGGQRNALDTTQVSITSFETIIGTHDGVNVKLYRQGAEKSTNTAGDATGSSAGSYVIGQSAGSPSFGGDVALFLRWDRGLSAAEAKSLSENPWQIFEPEVQWVWVDDYVSAGGGATVIPIGVQATGYVGTPSATGAATTTPAGVSASSAVGTPVAVGGSSIPATALPAGVQATAAVGTVSATGAALSQPVGVVASGTVGTPVAIAGTSIPATVLPAGVQASSAVGTPTVTAAAIAQPLGVAATAYVGTPTIATGVSGVAVAYPAGVQAIGQVGTLIATGAAWTAAVGVQAVASVGTPAAYAGEIVIYIAGAQTRPSRLQSSSRPSRLQTGTRASR